MFVLISDGMDGASRGSYSGIEGFRSCVEDLQELNIDVEFHIVGLDLPEDACDVFRQVSGSTGGVFYNLGNSNEGDEESLEEVIENLNIAFDEAIDPALRARSRRRRQTEYLETCSDGDLQLTEIPSAVPDLKFDEQGVYSRLGVTELNPDQMEVWETSLLSLAGHSEVQIKMKNTGLHRFLILVITEWIQTSEAHGRWMQATLRILPEAILTSSSHCRARFVIPSFHQSNVQLLSEVCPFLNKLSIS